MRQSTKVQFVPDPTISINNDLGVIGDACSIKYRISDSDPTVRFKIVHKLNGVVIEEKDNTTDSNYTINLTDEHLSELSFNSTNNITIELNNTNGSRILDKTVTFTKGNTKPKLNISSYNSTSATFTAIDTDNNLSKIEWFIDDVLKETITTDLYLEKTINYELTDNAIHTLKIVATDAENATAEKVLSISKEIMPLQEDANLSDISTKLAEIGEGFKNGKTSIINTLALKNIDASLNNTLVELSEKIKTSFDSSDASVQELQNRITELTNQLSQRIKYATGTYTIPDGTSSLVVPTNLTFVPKTIIVKIFSVKDGSNPSKTLSAYPCMTGVNQNLRYDNGSYTRVIGNASIRDVTADSFKIELGKSDFNAGVEFPFTFYSKTFRWYALDIEFLNN
ncbi:hypothetical protein [Clostridioides difficile]|uniref:hypothetical protein n=1 Tax=Clostridioides difficile TaxID=1496 RepID=UPI00097A7C4C|nr:hypothetical protein [Clostridioides difficile]OMK58414.1 hypothetical protein BER40_000989 [Clostridioides difficile]VFD36435.1 Uncharacterised protein [Clostridioides difficile]